MTSQWASLLCACLLFSTLLVYGSPQIDQDTSYRQSVISNILNPKSYDKRVRPAGPNSTTTKIIIQLNLMTINDLDPVEETLTTTAWLNIGWYDNRLTWKVPDDTPGVSTDVHVPQDEVWRPDIALKNSHTDLKALGNKYMNVLIYAGGYVGWFPFHVFQSNCDLDISHFPFDVQTCELRFAAWSFVSGQVDFILAESHTVVSSYQPNNHFDLINHKADVRLISNSSVAVFTLELQRKPHFVVMTNVVPIVVLALLSMCVFILPFDSGEKISYSVTVFLAFMVELAYVSSILPDNSDSVSYLALYIISQVVQCALQTAISIIMCRCYNLDEDQTPIPNILVFLAKKCCLSKKQKQNNNQDHSKKVTDENNESNERNPWKRRRSSYLPTSFGQEFNTNNAANARRLSNVDPGRRNGRNDSMGDNPGTDYSMDSTEEERGDREKALGETRQVTWKTIANGLDTFCFVFFLLLCTGFTVLFFTASALGL